MCLYAWVGMFVRLASSVRQDRAVLIILWSMRETKVVQR